MIVLGNGYVEITDNTPLTTCSANSLVSQIQATGWNGAFDTSGNEYCIIYSAPLKFPIR
jgi:hypothetical protein